MSEFLAGLEPPKVLTPMQKAVEIQIAKLSSEGVLNDSHAIIVQTIRELAQAVALSAARGRATGTAAAARELRESLEKLPNIEANDGMSSIVSQLKLVANG